MSDDTKNLSLTRPETELLHDALAHWSDRLHHNTSDSPAYRAAGAHVQWLIERVLEKLNALREEWE